jgi:hypothetical protein
MRNTEIYTKFYLVNLSFLISQSRPRFKFSGGCFYRLDYDVFKLFGQDSDHWCWDVLIRYATSLFVHVFAAPTRFNCNLRIYFLAFPPHFSIIAWSGMWVSS